MLLELVELDELDELDTDNQGSKHTNEWWREQSFSAKPRKNKRIIEYTKGHHQAYSRIQPLCTPNDPTCELMGDWQEAYHPSCNSFHEIDLTTGSTSTSTNTSPNTDFSTWINAGYYRDVWKIVHSQMTFALKTMRYTNNRPFDPASFKRHRRDAAAHDFLTASPYVANIYGYCGNSALHDFSSQGDLSNLFHTNQQVTKHELLQIAYRVASSIADTHHVNEQGGASIVHNDIKPNQWILINGEYYLNDFNRDKLLTWNPTTNKTNEFYFTYNSGKWRSPEEYAHEMETEKVDVWSLGNVLYFLQTRKEPFSNEENINTIYDIVKKGGYPKVEDEALLQSKHPFDVAVRKAMEMCFVKNVEQRASARDVQQVFAKALKQVVE